MKSANKLSHRFSIITCVILLFTAFLIPVNANNDSDHLVEGIDYDVVEYFVPFESDDAISVPSSRAWWGWSVRGVSGPYSHSKGIGPYVKGSPGQTIKLDHYVTISYSVTTSTGISVGDVSASIGSTVTQSRGVTLGSSLYVPSTYNGRRVESAELYARAESNQYAYQIYYLEGKVTNGQANVFTGIRYLHYYYYK
ncbi:hypothetical protein G7062_00265 [Erysipelothrix sp. HDW6C]|uniref:hypothetical protein n=1 Tax=Erysipelothrix sp. HDW6C TaxID=2714930 RepID=UPI00140D50BD|nr:hypothetical protein [Erysipelothrix sp. HDW6C]QIK68808.1 hypothetical protein G7062_00265 [Erysipelothrix sp. HDW6C]